MIAITTRSSTSVKPYRRERRPLVPQAQTDTGRIGRRITMKLLFRKLTRIREQRQFAVQHDTLRREFYEQRMRIV
jgi:hypothetical protein